MVIATFSNVLSSLVRHISKHNTLIISSDIIVHICKAENKFCLYDTPDRNGEDLALSFFSRTGLYAETLNSKKEGKTMNLHQPKKSKSQLDYRFIKKLLNRAMNCKNYPPFEKKNLLIRELCQQVFPSKSSQNDWCSLLNCDIRNRYSLNERNIFDALHKTTERHMPTDEYENIVTPNKEASAEIFMSINFFQTIVNIYFFKFCFYLIFFRISLEFLWE